MGGWRCRFILMLIIYFAGFVTAVYYLAPRRADAHQVQTACTSATSQAFAIEFNGHMQNALDFGKRAAVRTGDVIKEKMHETSERKRNIDG